MPPNRWLELRIESWADLDRITPILLDLGGSAVQEIEGALLTYLPPPGDLEEFLRRARHRLQEELPDQELRVTHRWQPQEDWESLWRQGLGLRRITPRLLVAPSWVEVRPAPGELLITLDPGMAFGTAEHATTRGSLRALDSMVDPGSRIADVGSGSGILSIGAALLGARRILALEVDPMACETARENVVRNEVQDQVVVVQALVEGGAPIPSSPFDGIVANLQTHLLLPLLGSFHDSLSHEGWLIGSGILLEEANTVREAATRAGFRYLRGEEEEGWWTGIFRALPFRS
jgi:ribosomal protein L11 methyltransferase